MDNTAYCSYRTVLRSAGVSDLEAKFIVRKLKREEAELSNLIEHGIDYTVHMMYREHFMKKMGFKDEKHMNDDFEVNFFFIPYVRQRIYKIHGVDVLDAGENLKRGDALISPDMFTKGKLRLEIVSGIIEQEGDYKTFGDSTGPIGQALFIQRKTGNILLGHRFLENKSINPNLSKDEKCQLVEKYMWKCID